MLEQLRLIGLEMGMTGTGIIEKIMKGELSTDDLNYEQVQQVLSAWDTRNYVPIHKMNNVDKVRPLITKEEVADGTYSQEEYDRNYVEMIGKYLKTLW